MFWDIYGIHHVKLSDNAFHLMEELGEVTEQLERRSLKALAEEVTDVLSWTCTLSSSIDRMSNRGTSDPSRSLDRQVYRYLRSTSQRDYLQHEPLPLTALVTPEVAREEG